MNIETTLAIHAYGTSEGTKKAWDTRGRAGDKLLKFTEPEGLPESNDFHTIQIHNGNYAVIQKGKQFTGSMSTVLYNGDLEDAKSSVSRHQDRIDKKGIYAPKNKMAAGCHGANCGRKGRKAGAKPLRSYMTKQESDTLNSKALKVKSRKKARKKY